MSEENISFTKCPVCGNDVPTGKFCPLCGSEINADAPADKTMPAKAVPSESITITDSNNKDAIQKNDATENANIVVAMPTDAANYIASHSTSTYENIGYAPTVAQEATAERNSYKIAFIVLLTLALCVILVVAYAFATVEKRTVIDVESYERGTGVYNVSMDSDNPCYIGEDWTDCINAYVDEYNSSCANRKLTKGYIDSVDIFLNGSTTNATGSSLCKAYSNHIDEMKEKDCPGCYVSSLGSWGHLHVEELTKTVPAVTHEAVCYLGFIGECIEED